MTDEYYKIDKTLFDVFIRYVNNERMITQAHADDSRIEEILEIIKKQGFKLEEVV